nr:hypothetical protein [Planctomycetota bacterium]
AFFAPVSVTTVDHYLAQVDRARAALSDDTLDCLESDPELSAIDRDHPPARARHVLSCTACAQLFILAFGGCDVIGDQWRALHGN